MNCIKKSNLSADRDKSSYIVKRLAEYGFKAFFAGGSVRDMVLGKEPADFDIVTNASVKDVLSVFAGEKVKKVGKTFEICMVNGIEVAPCRSASYRETQTVDTFPESDLAHRDITINSMAFDPVTCRLIDPFGGQKDLADRIVRFTGSPENRIAEDPIRMVRACRFASWMQGTLASSTLESISKNRHLVIEKSAPERVRYEILKAMVHEKPSLFFRALNATGLLDLIFPSLSRCTELDGGPYHGETVLEHCLLSGDALSPRNPVLRLAGYLHDAGKYDAAKIKDGRITFPDHEKMGEAVLNDLHNLRFSSEEIRFIGAVIKTHMRPLKPDSTPRAVRRLLYFLKQNDVKWQTFMQMRIADKSANLAKHSYTPSDIKLRVSKIRQELKSHKSNGASIPLTVKELDISGNEVMEILDILPGPEVGRAMDYLLECVLDNPSLNAYESLRNLLYSSSDSKFSANF